MNLLIIGYYLELDKNLLNFESSAGKFKTPYKLLEINHQNKFTSLLELILNDTDYDTFCLVNVSESLICCKIEEISEKFNKYKDKIIFGTQGIIEDGIELKKYWKSLKDKNKTQNLEKQYSKRRDLIIPNNQYICNKGYIGGRRHIVRLIEFMIKNEVSIVSERERLCYFIELNTNICKLDTLSDIFGNITSISPFEEGDLPYFNIKNDRIIDERSDKTPCIISIPNSDQDLNVRMYKYGKFILDDAYHYNMNYIKLALLVFSVFPLIFINDISMGYIMTLCTVIFYVFYYFFCLYL
tara:strand:- start:5806 stop:6696 length:891 start_codon:yes stop_codon:yes gene_type:complete